MAESVEATLKNYRYQLKQVEAAIIAEPDNVELHKLKEDLEEVIELTEELVPSASGVEGGSDSDMEPSTTSKALHADDIPIKHWKVGDRCMAPSPKNKKIYPGIIDEIVDDQAAVTFTDFADSAACPLSQLREEVAKDASDKKPRHKNQYQIDKDKRKLKNQKRREKLKAMEEAREKDKNKWLEFSKRGAAKNMKGFKRVQNVPENVSKPNELKKMKHLPGGTGVTGAPRYNFKNT